MLSLHRRSAVPLRLYHAGGYGLSFYTLALYRRTDGWSRWCMERCSWWVAPQRMLAS